MLPEWKDIVVDHGGLCFCFCFLESFPAVTAAGS